MFGQPRLEVLVEQVPRQLCLGRAVAAEHPPRPVESESLEGLDADAPVDVDADRAGYVEQFLLCDETGSASGESFSGPLVDGHGVSWLSLRESNNTNNLVSAVTAKVLLRLERFAEAVEVANRIMDDAS